MRNYVKEAHDLHVAGKYMEAEAMYHACLNAAPKDPLLLFYLGTLFMQTDRNGVAINLLEKAVEVKPDFPEAWMNLGCSYRRENLVREAEHAFLKQIEVAGESAVGYSNLGSVFVGVGDPEPGEKYLRKSIELDPFHAQAHWNLSFCLLEQEKFGEGFDEYEWGLESGDRMFRNYEVPVWDGRPVDTLVVYGEQGLGDELLFATCLWDLKKLAKNIILEVNPRQAKLFARSFPNMTVYGTRKQEYIDWPLKHKIDAKVAMGSLPRYFRRSPADFPRHEGFLVPDPEKAAHWKAVLEQLGDKPKIGISWIGGKKKTRIDLRSMPLEWLHPVLKSIDATWVSLQYTKQAEDEIKAYMDKGGVPVYHWDHAVANKGADDEMDELAALMSNLDLVITVCTTVLHVGAALNKPVWVMTPPEAPWREGSWRPNMLWWPAQTLMFRKQKGEDWSNVIESVRTQAIRWAANVGPQSGVDALASAGGDGESTALAANR